MIDPITAFQYGIGAVAVLVSGALAGWLWRQRSEPTVRPLLGLAGTIFLGAVAYLGVLSPVPVERVLAPLGLVSPGVPLWLVVLNVVAIFVAGFWFLFTLGYTGRGGRLLPLATAMVVLLWGLIFGLVLFGDLTPPPDAGAEAHLEVALGVGLLFMGALLIVGILIVLATAVERNALRFGEALSLSGAASLLAVGTLAANTTFRTSAVPMTLLLASGLFVLTLRRYPVVEAPPVARIAGRDRLIEEMDAGVVVVDRESRIRDLNPAAERLLDVDRSEVLGEALEQLLPFGVDPGSLTATDGSLQLQTENDDVLVVTANEITDARDRSFGTLLVFRDVTERQRRERRLGVLNQVLTGAVTDRMDVVAGEASRLRTSNPSGDASTADGREPSRVGGRIRAQTAELLEFVRRTREIERALAEPGTEPADVESAIRTASGTDSLRIETEGAGTPPAVAVDPAILDAMVETLLVAAEQGPGTMDIEITATDCSVEIHLIDDGAPLSDRPAADDQGMTDDGRYWGELSVELVRLAAQAVGGNVSVREASGDRRLAIELPRANTEGPVTEPLVDGEGGIEGETGRVQAESDDRGDAT